MAEQQNNVTTNTFTKGMVKDLNETFVGEGLWTHARNLVNNSHDGQTGVVGNEPANLKCVDLPYELIGAIHITDDIWAIFTTDDTDSEIGLFDESKCLYTKVVNDRCLNFNRANLITGISRRRYDCQRPVYWADGRNPDRFMDIVPEKVPYKYTETTDDNGCVVKVYSDELDCEAIRLAAIIDHPCLHIERGKVAGTLPNGSYQAVIAYTINQVRITDYIGITEVQSLFTHENVSSSLEIIIDSIDQNFDEFELVILANINAQTVAKKIGYYSTSQGRIYVDRWDTEYETIPLSQIVLRTDPVDKSDGMYGVNQYLLRLGTYSKFKFNYQPQANQIRTSWAAVQYPANYYHKGGNNAGYMRDEQYPFFIRFIYNTGERTESYHIPGRAATADDRSIIFGDDAYENIDGIVMQKWQVYNTATVEEFVNEDLLDGGKVIAKGKMGYWESTELYPDDKPEVWGELCGKPIRIAKMPDETVHPMLSTFNNQGDNIVILGVQFDNITHPVDNAGNPITSIVGYEILRGSREGNKSIIAKGLLNNMREYTIPGNTVKGLYQNYPYNDLRPDEYLTSQPQTGDNGKVNVNSPKLSVYKKDIFSFHSPEVSFSNPFLNTTELKIYQQVDGKSKGQFEVPYKHPQFKQLTNGLEGALDLFVDAITAMQAAQALFGNFQIELQSSDDLPVVRLGVNQAFAEGPFGTLGTAANLTATALNGVFLATYMAFIGGKVTKQQILNIILTLIPKRHYAFQFNSHGFYNNASPALINNTRRKIVDSAYTGSSLQNFTNEYQINNLHRSKVVVLKTSQSVIDPSIVDNSRTTMGIENKPVNTLIEKTIASHYGAIKSSIPSQYGQLESIKQLIASNCVFDIADRETSVIFGGDTYVNRFTEKNTMFFFNTWLMGEPDEMEFDYTLYSNVPYPRYWMNNTKVLGGLFDLASEYRSLDFKQSDSKNFFYLKRGAFYLFNSGVRDFFVESEINVAHRDWEEDIQKRHYDPYRFTDLQAMFRSDIIRSGNYYKYDYALSVSKLFNSSITWGNMLPRDYDPELYESCYTYRPNRMIYSLPQQDESKKDNWRVFLANNYKDFNSPVTSIKPVNRTGALIMMERQSPMQFMGVEELKLDATGAKIAIGDGGLFNQPLQNIVNTDESYEYGSCQNRLAVSSNTHGVFWVSQDQGKVFQFAGQLNEISREGMKWWFAKYLPSQLLKVYPDFPLKDNPLVGVGVQMIYDNTNELLYITKKDYVPKRLDLLHDEEGFYYINGYSTITTPGPKTCPAGWYLDNDQCVRRTIIDPIITINGNESSSEGGNTESCPDCTQFISDSYYSSDYHQYPTSYCVYVSGGGEYFELLYDALGRPNRFTVYDPAGNNLGSSGWVGTADYPGPWGISLNTLPNGTLRINKPAGFSGTYYIKVEAGPADPENVINDNFQISFSCPNAGEPPVENPDVVITYSCPSGYSLINGNTPEPKCERYEYTTPTQSDVVTQVPNKVRIALTDPAFFTDASWTISYDPKSKTWVSFHDWHPTFMLPGKQHFMTVDRDDIWKHNVRCDLYCNFYDKDYPFEIEFLSATGQMVNTIRSIEYLFEAYKYHNDCRDKYHVLDENFDQAIIYNSEQVSGLLELVNKPKNSPVAALSYPQINTTSISILYTKEEQKYRINQFWDITKDRGEFTAVDIPMFVTSPNGYQFLINPQYVDYNKSAVQRKKFRHNVNRVWLRKWISGNKKLLFKLSNQKNLNSPR